ncbi:MAG: hypothetical protein JXA92_14160 [candidate division Zixibacteria bacterium]|nr:hypothetical protein [candidate division Zixibacteria bacterium]
MVKRLTLVFSTAAIFIFTMGWIGCSENDTILITSMNGNDAADEFVSYFPLEEGHTSYYEVTYSNGSTEELTFRIGSEVPFGSITAIQWFIQSSTGSRDTNYIVATDSSIYLYTDYQAVPEKILYYPLQPGVSWNRFVSTDEVIADVGDDDKAESDDDDTDTDGGVLSADYPTTGIGDMLVENSETVLLNSGLYYSGSVKITNSSSEDLKNYYWYAPGIGLVKYIIGTTDNTYPAGQAVGELVSYN